MKGIRICISVFTAIWFLSCARQQQPKINGISFVASSEKITKIYTDPVVRLNANYAAIMPFAYIHSLDSPTVHYDGNKQWFGETIPGVKQYISELKKNNIEIMLKPQLWVSQGEFTGNINMISEADWVEFETTYENFIMKFVKVAEEEHVKIFCIGTELERFVKHRPNYWVRLIEKIKEVYKGKLTYAANWDEYSKTTFWNELDYIGVNGYFPLTKDKTPKREALKTGWINRKLKMKKHADSLQKKILFTEFGYRSVDYTAVKPWDVDYSKTTVNLQGQTNATQVLFEELWQEEWFAGGFIWKWFVNYDKAGGHGNSRFTPQNKPVEDVIRKFYGKKIKGQYDIRY